MADDDRKPDRHEAVLALLDALIGFDTTSRNSNLALLEFVEARLEPLGVHCTRIPSGDGRKANLLARIGPDVDGGVMLSGHTDTVPVDGQDWRTDPFRMEDDGHRLWGRGTADMKGFIAAALIAAEDAAQRSLRKPLYLALTYDEEIGCLGVPGLIEALRGHSSLPAFCLVGEPTSMAVGLGHKGACAYEAEFRGRAAHSSLAPTAVNAVEYAAEFVTRLTALGRRFQAEGPFDEGYDITHTTVHTGIIRGGTQVNIVPSHCAVAFEFRPLPDSAPEGIEQRIRGWIEDDIDPAMKARDDDTGAELARRYAYPGLRMPPDADCVRLLQRLLGDATTTNVAFGTEAGSYQSYLDLPSLVCGPGSIRQAHQPDEYLDHEQLRRCENLLATLVAWLAEDGVIAS